MEASQDFWKKCSSCKKPIAFGAPYYVCSVSTCNGQRTGYVFCSMPCFEVHLPGARHRDAGGIQKTAPSQQDGAAAFPRDPVRRKIVPSSSAPGLTTASTAGPSGNQHGKIPQDILIVQSKLKDYINARSGMNTSAAVMEVLSDLVRQACDDAIDQARQQGRKTVLDRDFKKS